MELQNIIDFEHFNSSNKEKNTRTKLLNIVDLDDFIAENEEKNNSSYSDWWDDCISQVIEWITTDQTTTNDNLRDKAISYGSNYLSLVTGSVLYDNRYLVSKIADEVEERLKDAHFNQHPLSYYQCQDAHNSIPEDPSRRFIKLDPKYMRTV